ncbi:MAG: hypothetical protein P8Y44_04885 [Acidobacteriota bacterium]
MTKTLNHLPTALGLVALVTLLPQVAWATKAIAEQENLQCTSCHDKPGSKLLTDKGMYYEMIGSLAGFENLDKEFERCTTCHSKKPGSKKLTETGEKYKFVVDDMEGLRIWLMEQHPTPAETTETQKQEKD